MRALPLGAIIVIACVGCAETVTKRPDTAASSDAQLLVDADGALTRTLRRGDPADTLAKVDAELRETLEPKTVGAVNIRAKSAPPLVLEEPPLVTWGAPRASDE